MTLSVHFHRITLLLCGGHTIGSRDQLRLLLYCLGKGMMTWRIDTATEKWSTNKEFLTNIRCEKRSQALLPGSGLRNRKDLFVIE